MLSQVKSSQGGPTCAAACAPCSCEKSVDTSMRSKDILQRVFDFFVHMSSEAMPYEMDSATLGDKARAARDAHPRALPNKSGKGHEKVIQRGDG